MNSKVIAFVKAQLGIFTRTNDLHTREEIAAAMKANMTRWVEMAIACGVA